MAAMNRTRRAALTLVTATIVTSFAAKALAAVSRTPWIRKPVFLKESERQDMQSFEGIHEGNGTVGMKVFKFDGAPTPANFLIYDMSQAPAKARTSTGMNNHELGSYDEYYYIVSGSGIMEIDGQIVDVKAGDHVFTALDVHHGIENTSTTENLKVFLTYIERT